MTLEKLNDELKGLIQTIKIPNEDGEIAQIERLVELLTKKKIRPDDKKLNQMGISAVNAYRYINFLRETYFKRMGGFENESDKINAYQMLIEFFDGMKFKIDNEFYSSIHHEVTPFKLTLKYIKNYPLLQMAESLDELAGYYSPNIKIDTDTARLYKDFSEKGKYAEISRYSQDRVDLTFYEEPLHITDPTLFQKDFVKKIEETRQMNGEKVLYMANHRR